MKDERIHRNGLLGLLILLSTFNFQLSTCHAQVSNAGRSVFSFMALPVSSRINALGGSSASLSDGDIALGMCNPALLHANSHQKLELNFS